MYGKGRANISKILISFRPFKLPLHLVPEHSASKYTSQIVTHGRMMLHTKEFLILLLNMLPVKCNIVANNISRADVVKILLAENNKYSLPPFDGDQPHIVHIRTHIKSIFDISEQSSSLTVRYFLNICWYDTRLIFTPFKENNKTVEYIRLPIDLFKENGMYEC